MRANTGFIYMKAKVAQCCLTLCDPKDYTVHGILQARILEWVAFPFSRGSSQPRDPTQVTCIAGGFFTRWATREVLCVHHTHTHTHTYRLPRWLSGKEFTKAREMGSIPGWGRSPGEEMATHYRILAWWATVHGLTISQTWLSNWAHIHTYTHTYTHTHIHTYFKILIYIICSSVLTFTFCVKYIFHNMKSNICHI